MAKLVNFILIILFFFSIKIDYSLFNFLNNVEAEESGIKSINFDSKVTTLSPKRIIELTNKERLKNKIPKLRENEILNLTAEKKIDDMVSKQYFAHFSPEGEGINDLVKNFNYEYIVVAENLAMGDFKDEKELVDGWMKSYGHRRNILNSKFREIGVAVRKVNFKGKKVWFAVQHFGTPISVCQQPNKNLKFLIDETNKKLDYLHDQLLLLKTQIENFRNFEEYYKLVTDYNNLVKKYNNLLEFNRFFIDEYNSQVREFNSCVLKFK